MTERVRPDTLGCDKTEAVAVKRMFTSSSRRKQGKGAPGYLRDVAYAFMRQMFDGLGTEQTQFLIPTTDKVYNLVTKAKRITPKTVDLGNGAQGHWIGQSQANNVMLYIHGKHTITMGRKKKRNNVSRL